MTKDEMKNKISMALKDPILQQGFEIICKNLLELEEENAELKAKIYGGGYEAVITKKDADIILLEHLLKEQKELHKSVCNQLTHTHRNPRNQLTKAKDHIRTLISCLINWVQEGDKDYCYITDAEQFLKECE